MESTSTLWASPGRRAGDPGRHGGSSQPVVGFFGLIERRIDLELLDYLAGITPALDFPHDRPGGGPDPAASPPAEHPFHRQAAVRELAGLRQAVRRSDHPLPPDDSSTTTPIRSSSASTWRWESRSSPSARRRSTSTPTLSRSPDRTRSSSPSSTRSSSEPAGASEIQRRIGRVAGESWDARLGEVLEIVDRHWQGKQVPKRSVSAVASQTH